MRRSPLSGTEPASAAPQTSGSATEAAASASAGLRAAASHSQAIFNLESALAGLPTATALSVRQRTRSAVARSGRVVVPTEDVDLL